MKTINKLTPPTELTAAALHAVMGARPKSQVASWSVTRITGDQRVLELQGTVALGGDRSKRAKAIAATLARAGYVADVAPPESKGDAPVIVVSLPAAPKPARATRFHVGMLIGKHRTHAAADEFPLMNEADLAELTESVREHGLQEKIWLIKVDGAELILDGRNRYLACIAAHVKPEFRFYTGRDPYAFVKIMGLDRRHMTASQRAMVASALATMAHGGARRGAAAGHNLSTAEAAKIANASRRMTDRAASVRANAVPEVVAATVNGAITVEAAEQLAKLDPAEQRKFVADELGGGTTASKEARTGRVGALVRQKQRAATVAKINTRPMPMPRGPFGQIVVDYPWQYANSDGHEGSRGHVKYPSMTIEQILKHAELTREVAATDCVLWIWITNAFMHELGAVLRAWGFQIVTVVTWDKRTKNDKAKTGMGLAGPRGRTEHVVMATRGKPAHTLNETETMFAGVVREHSRKPEEFFEIYTKRVAGPHLELFSQTPREGWQSWGAEAGKYAAEESAA